MIRIKLDQFSYMAKNKEILALVDEFDENKADAISVMESLKGIKSNFKCKVGCFFEVNNRTTLEKINSSENDLSWWLRLANLLRLNDLNLNEKFFNKVKDEQLEFSVQNLEKIGEWLDHEMSLERAFEILSEFKHLFKVKTLKETGDIEIIFKYIDGRKMENQAHNSYCGLSFLARALILEKYKQEHHGEYTLDEVFWNPTENNWNMGGVIKKLCYKADIIMSSKVGYWNKIVLSGSGKDIFLTAKEKFKKN